MEGHFQIKNSVCLWHWTKTRYLHKEIKGNKECYITKKGLIAY